MSVGRIAAIGFVFVCTTAAWMILGASVYRRTYDRSRSVGEAVEALWGSAHRQTPPRGWCVWEEKKIVQVQKGERRVSTVQVIPHRDPLPLTRSHVTVNFHWDPRRKGLLWYRTYKVQFQGSYIFQHSHPQPHNIEVEFAYPTDQAIYDDFHFVVNGRESEQPLNIENGVRERVTLHPVQEIPVRLAYRSQGLDRWLYDFGGDRDAISRVKNFNLTMMTDFKEIDFPARTLSPTTKQATRQGWKLTWDYKSLISGFQIGMEMPEKLNPGPLAARMSFFAPVSLFFFFFMLFVITVLRNVRLHPMHYFFLGCAFFSFHVLFSYLVDHLLPLPAFLICSAVSVGLVVSYLRLVTGMRFAVVEVGLSQLIYLILFSYAFFFEGYTGLTITVISILSLFVVMQLTGRVNWEEKFAKGLPQMPRVPSQEASEKDAL
jgi:hypothetical protein